MTEEEAKIAASRAGLRAALAGRLTLVHVAPLVAFGLVLVFTAVLAFTGLIGARAGEAALILAAIAFMANRFAAHWRLRRAQKNALAAATAAQRAGPITIRLDDSGLRIETAAGSRHLALADCDEAEFAGPIIYLWPRKGEPAFLPARIFENEQAAKEFFAFARAGIGRAAKLRRS